MNRTPSNASANPLVVGGPTARLRVSLDGFRKKLPEHPRPSSPRVARYTLFPKFLVNKRPRPPRIIGEGALTVDNRRLLARIVQELDGTRWLELHYDPLEVLEKRGEPLSLSDATLRAVYDALAQAHTVARARHHAATAGRN